MFEPRNLKSDRPFPLLPYIRINADLTQGEWKIIFAKWDCSTCERFLRGGNCKPNGQERVAVVLVIDKEDWTLYQECKAVLGGLSPKKIWRIQTPTTLRLKDGRFQMMN